METSLNNLFRFMARLIHQLNQPSLATEFAHLSMSLTAALRSEREQLKQEITNDVLSRISVSADTTKAVMEIDKLKKALHSI